MKTTNSPRLGSAFLDVWKSISYIFAPILMIMVVIALITGNGRPTDISQLGYRGVLVNQNPDQGWALFEREDHTPVLLKNHDHTLVVGKTYSAVAHRRLLPKGVFIDGWSLIEVKD